MRTRRRLPKWLQLSSILAIPPMSSPQNRNASWNTKRILCSIAGNDWTYYQPGRVQIRLTAKAPTNNVIPIMVQSSAVNSASAVNLYRRSRNKVAANINKPIPNAYSHRTIRSLSIWLRRIYAHEPFQSMNLGFPHIVFHLIR